MLERLHSFVYSPKHEAHDAYELQDRLRTELNSHHFGQYVRQGLSDSLQAAPVRFVRLKFTEDFRYGDCPVLSPKQLFFVWIFPNQWSCLTADLGNTEYNTLI